MSLNTWAEKRGRGQCHIGEQCSRPKRRERNSSRRMRRASGEAGAELAYCFKENCPQFTAFVGLNPTEVK